MNFTTRLLLLAALAPLLLLTSCSSGEYQLKSNQGQDYAPYETWNTLPKNS
jgi:hypothetical protein